MTSDRSSRRPSAALVRRLLLFTAPPLLASFSPLLVLSSIAHTSPTAIWLSLLLGQAIGSIGCLIATWGWDIGGPARAAPLDEQGRRALLGLSLAGRLPIGLAAVIVGAVLSLLLAPAGGGPLAALTAVAGTLQALSLNWWFVATGRPGGIILTDAVPRAVAAVAATAAIVLGAAAWVYPVLLLATTGTAYASGYRRFLAGVRRPTAQEVRRSVIRDWRLATIAIASTMYTTATLPIVQWLNPLAAPAFGAAQRIASYWSFSTVVLGNTAQNWVNRLGRAGVPRRAKVALVIFTIEGLVLGAALWLLGPIVARLLLGRADLVPAPLFGLFGVTFLAIAMSTALGRLYLVPIGRERDVAAVTFATAIVGVVALGVGSVSAGAVGAAAAVAATEVFATALLGVAAFRTSRTRSPHPPASQAVSHAAG